MRAWLGLNKGISSAGLVLTGLVALGGCSAAMPDGSAPNGSFEPVPITQAAPDGGWVGTYPSHGPASSDDILDDGKILPRSVYSAEAKLPNTGVTPVDPQHDGTTKPQPFGQLKQPDLVRLLPPGLTQVGPDAAMMLIATPVAQLTPGYAKPTDPGPIMALNEDTDMLLNMPAHWAVVGKTEGWVQILTPVGRGSLPSKDPSQVNHHTLWVKDSDVTLTHADYKIEVDTTAYTMTVTGPDGSHTFHIGVGKTGQTDTPKGLCAIVGKVTIQSGEPGLLTNCQSERMDYFDGAADAATAIHEYDPLGFNPATGGAVSNGCMRIPDSSFEKYLEEVPAGTPVIIH